MVARYSSIVILPTQVTPSPVNPGRHIHSKLPIVLVHSANIEQLSSPNSHSSISRGEEGCSTDDTEHDTGYRCVYRHRWFHPQCSQEDTHKQSHPPGRCTWQEGHSHPDFLHTHSQLHIHKHNVSIWLIEALNVYYICPECLLHVS